MVFPTLTVEENIMTGLRRAPSAVFRASCTSFFPVLKEMRKRRAR